MATAYHEILKIDPPKLEVVRDHPEANTYSLLIVALIERGGPMTLDEVAARFEAAGVAPARDALMALKRCRPARPPIYREGEFYCLDAFDDDADLWAFRLGLRPAKVARVVPPEPPALPGPEVRLSVAELDRAWADASLNNAFSARQLALAVLDAHGGPMRPEDVVAAVRARTKWFVLPIDTPSFKRRGSPVVVDADGRWAIADGAEGLQAVRLAVRERLAMQARYTRPSPEDIAAHARAAQQRRAARGAELAMLRRVIVHGCPGTRPEALALLDVEERTIRTFLREEIAEARERMQDYDVIAGLEMRTLVGAIGFDAAARRLVELGPPQKTRRLNQRGRILKITPELLIAGSCGITRPFDPERLQAYLRAGDDLKLRRRLESEVKSLHALYEYGRLHGALRLRWGFLDERLPAPWVDWNEPHLGDLKKQALELGVPLQVVVGGAPGWADPWSRAIPARVVRGEATRDLHLVDDSGVVIHEPEIQLVRLAATVH